MRKVNGISIFCCSDVAKKNMVGMLRVLVLFLGLITLNACRYYRNNHMFQTDRDVISTQMSDSMVKAERNYLIRVNDYIAFQVYTNEGEIIVDPNGQFRKAIHSESGGGGGGSGGQSAQSGQAQGQRYLVYQDGTCDLPLLGKTMLAGLNVRQADSLLKACFSKYYNDAYVQTRVLNQRVFLLGGLGSHIITLDNQGMTLIEVLAKVGQAGILNQSSTAKYYNIRLIRGDLRNPNVHLIDLTTIEGLRKADLYVHPNDIIYVEPYRRIISESFTDIYPLISISSTLLTLIILLSKF